MQATLKTVTALAACAVLATGCTVEGDKAVTSRVTASSPPLPYNERRPMCRTEGRASICGHVSPS
jgi:hypothetical protein